VDDEALEVEAVPPDEAVVTVLLEAAPDDSPPVLGEVRDVEAVLDEAGVSVLREAAPDDPPPALDEV